MSNTEAAVPIGMRVLIEAGELMARVEELAGEIASDPTPAELHILAIAEGGIPLADALAQQLPAVAFDELAVSSYRGERSAVHKPKISKPPPREIRGRSVLIVDDIYDTGRTLQMVTEEVAAAGAAEIRICVLLRKQKIRECQVPIDYCGFDISDEFVVGYGLDYGGRYRNLPYIGVLDDD